MQTYNKTYNKTCGGILFNHQNFNQTSTFLLQAPDLAVFFCGWVFLFESFFFISPFMESIRY